MDAPRARVRGSQPEALGAILSRHLKQSGLLRPAAQHRLASAWCQAVGEEAARHTRVVGLRRRVLEVLVDSAPRLQELANFEKPGILLRLGDLLGGAHVADIRFRPGPMAPDETRDA